MKDSVLHKIGDVLIVNIVPELTGYIRFSSYSEAWIGTTSAKTVLKEFRTSEDGIFWSEWSALTNENVTKERFVADGRFSIQLRFTRTGADNSGDIEFVSIQFRGSVDRIQSVFPTLSASIFADLIGTSELKELEENLFKKLYYRGILPNYIIRGANLDIDEDSDFVDVFFSVARFFAIIMRFFARFENFKNDFDLIRENVRQYGLYFDESNITLEELQYLSQHLFDEIRKRGTAMIFKRRGDNVNGEPLPIDGELIRLLRSKPSDELLHETIPIHKVGWCLGQCSPMYSGTSQARQLNKTNEDSEDFVNLDNFVVTSSTQATKYAIQPFDNKKVLRLYNTSYSTGVTVGLGRVNEDMKVSTNKLIVVDSHLDYEITFAFQIVNGGGSLGNQILFGAEGFDVLGNRLSDAFITPNGGQVTETFFLESLLDWKPFNWYYARGIIHAYSSANQDKSMTNLGFGTNLYFNNSFVKYILPKIQVIGITVFDVKIWDYKIRPLVRGTNILPLKDSGANARSLGFIQSQEMSHYYIRNNNNSQSEDEITDIIERYLLPYNSTDIFMFMK